MKYEDLTLITPFMYKSAVIYNTNFKGYMQITFTKLREHHDPDSITRSGERMLKNTAVKKGEDMLLDKGYKPGPDLEKLVIGTLFYFLDDEDMKIPDERLLPCFFIVNPLKGQNITWRSNFVKYRVRRDFRNDMGYLHTAYMEPNTGNVVSRGTADTFKDFMEEL